MSKDKNNSGISFLGLLGITFIILKLTEVVDWKWIWVLAPLWGVLAIMLLVLFVALILTMIFD